MQGEEIARAADLFGQKYPKLRPGSTSAVVFFRLEPDSLEFIDNSRGVEEEATTSAPTTGASRSSTCRRSRSDALTGVFPMGEYASMTEHTDGLGR